MMLPNQRPLNGDEQYAMFEMVAITHAVEDITRDLRRRLTPQQAQKVKTIGTYAHNTVMDVLDKLTPDQRRRFVAISKTKSFKVQTTPPGGAKTSLDPLMTMISESGLKAIVTKATEECQFCDRRGIDVERCELKKVLDAEMLCETAEQESGKCWYVNV